MDKFSPEKRSDIMSHIRSKDTKPEMIVRKHLHALGFRYSLHAKRLPGHPDLVLRKWHTVIFINGCFWHRHPNCRLATVPKSNIDFWNAKFQRNVQRDAREQAELKAKGWKVIVVWECEVKQRLQTLPDEIRREPLRDGTTETAQTARHPAPQEPAPHNESGSQP